MLQMTDGKGRKEKQASLRVSRLALTRLELGLGRSSVEQVGH